MATNIPPHNLHETIAATIAFIDNPDIDTDGPDAAHEGPGLPDRRRDPRPVGGIRDAYETGRGRVRVRARAHIEQLSSGNREAIIVTELPFMVKKGGDGGVIRKIAELVTREEARPRSPTSRTTRTATACGS